jgi:predicted methyltransferase
MQSPIGEILECVVLGPFRLNGVPRTSCGWVISKCERLGNVKAFWSRKCDCRNSGPVSASDRAAERSEWSTWRFDGRKAYRQAADYVVKRIRLSRNTVVVDIGTGDGWWASRIAKKLGPKGMIHTGEVDQNKVDAMKQKWETVPQIKPYLCPTEGTGLNENSCDVAFISKTYHRFGEDTHVDYLRHLNKVIKPSGRVVIVERHADLVTGRGKEHAWQRGLLVLIQA